MHAGGPGLMKPTGQHHLQRAEMKPYGPQTRPPPAPACALEILSIKTMNRTGDKRQTCWTPTCTGNRFDLLPAMRTKVLSGHAETRQPSVRLPGPHTPIMSRIERDIQGSDDLLPVILKSGKITYLRENKLGQGSFGKVLHYKIQDTSEDVAVKFIKRKEGLQELKMLKKINAFDPDKNCFLKMLDHFEYKSFICVVSEKLDQTLSDIFLKRNQRPFDVCELRPVAQQLLVALRALKAIGLVHCDIKLNNVMFVNHQSYPYKVKLIDFGLVREKPSLRRISDIQIVGYKAPEVVFDCPLDEAVDMWSVGCVLAGMYKAKHLYPRTCLYDYIASIIHMQGQPPDNVLFKGSMFSFRKPSEYMGIPINTYRSKVTDGFFEQSFTLDDLLNQRKTRITPEEALNHNFITMKHLSERTKDPYVTSAREIMSVCEPVTTMQPDAPKSGWQALSCPTGSQPGSKAGRRALAFGTTGLDMPVAFACPKN
uniref:Protein kinase domain-containing protein n=1 Tax=Oryzias latipes TaxID=8090 RepID=A0A3P9LEN3_ORYLA